MASTTIPGTSKGLLAKVQAGCFGMWPIAGSLSAEKLELPTAAGWTCKEMLAHLAAYRLVEVARRLTLDELAEPRALGLVSWCTYLHYPDHTKELGLAP